MISRNGIILLASLHMRLFRSRPVVDLLMVFLLAIVSLTVSIGFVLYASIGSAFDRSGQEDVLIITSRNANSEAESFIQFDEVNRLRALLSNDSLLEYLDYDEQLVISTAVTSGNEVMYIGLRGIAQTEAGSQNINIIDGRAFRSGMNEVLIGRSLVGATPSFQLGETVLLANKEWKITGIYEMGGDIRENEFLGDLTQIQTRYGAEEIVNTIRLRGESEVLWSAHQSINDSDLDLIATKEKDFFSKQSESVENTILGIQIVIILLVVPAALAGMMSIQNVQIRNLTSELKTLFLLGFQYRSIALSMYARTLLFATIASFLALFIMMCLINNRNIEIDLGLQSTFVEFSPSIFIFSMVFITAIAIALISSLLTSIKNSILEVST